MGQPEFEIKQVPVVRMVIEYMPTTGEFRVGWPEMDDVAKLGMLEMAKAIVNEQRAKQAQSGIVRPVGMIQ